MQAGEEVAGEEDFGGVALVVADLDGVGGEDETGGVGLHLQRLLAHRLDAHSSERRGEGDVEGAIGDGAFHGLHGEAVEIEFAVEALLPQAQEHFRLIGAGVEIVLFVEPVHVRGRTVFRVLDDVRQQVDAIHLERVFAAPDALGALHDVVHVRPLLGPACGVVQA